MQPWSWAIFLGIKITDCLSFVMQLITLGLAYRIYKNLDLKKSFASKRLESVLSLNNEISKTLINFQQYRKETYLDAFPSGFSEIAFEASLFDILRLTGQEKYGKIYIIGSRLDFMPYISYTENPLLPRIIASKLKKFKYLLINSDPNLEKSVNYVILSYKGRDNNEIPSKVLDSDAYQDWNSFLSSSRELKAAMDDWMKKYLPEDINL